MSADAGGLAGQPPQRSWIAEARAVLATPPPRRLSGQAAGELRPAAVLVPLFVEGGELWTVLTKRADTLVSHPGQVAFPGGSREAGEDPWTAALRETSEELGLAPQSVLRLGELDEVDVPSGFRIVPCVGAVPRESWSTGAAGAVGSTGAFGMTGATGALEVRANAAEVAEVFRLPLSAFTNPRLVEDREVVYDGVRREVRIYHVGSRQIWGVTARILQILLARLGMQLDGAP